MPELCKHTDIYLVRPNGWDYPAFGLTYDRGVKPNRYDYPVFGLTHADRL